MINPSDRNSLRSKAVLLKLFVVLCFFALIPACNHKPSEPPLPEVDFAKARVLSDAVANDLVKEDVKDLSDRLDVGFHLIVRGPEDLKRVLEKMYGLYGRPVECVFKISQTGVRADGEWKRPSRTVYYAVKTTKYPMGKYFLKIEIVPAFSQAFLDVSGFGLFTFKDGNVPDYLK
jgi:hypothetical protein